ncbi:leucine-rich repeat neuronal protein 4-like [Mustelus asterias]
MEALPLFCLLTEVVCFLRRINGLPVDQPDHFLLYHMNIYSQNATQLHLSSKNISNIPVNTFQNFSALEILDLSHNSLTYNSLPCGSLVIPTLKHLNTASNELTTVPSCLPAALESLDLSKNVIWRIKLSEFTGLYNLKVLLLSHNKISEIVSSGMVMAQLESLDLSYNNLTKLQWEFQMPNLTMLRLEGNPLQQPNPYEFSCFPKLHHLNLSMTSLKLCTHKLFVSRMKNLKVLDLSANFFKTLDPQCFEGLSNLQFLRMRQMPFLWSLPANLFTHTPSLIHVDLEGSSQLHIVKSSMFESLMHLEFLSFKSCNLTEFRPWNLSTNSTVTISLSGNPLVCSCELTWLIIEPEKVVLNRTNDTRCHKNGSQREILLTDLIDECSINGNQTQESQVSASTMQSQLLGHTIANSSGNTKKISSSKLPAQVDISASSPNSTNLLNTLSFHGPSSNSDSGTLQTEQGTIQNDQSWAKRESRVKTSTPWSTTTNDRTGIKLYPTTANLYPAYIRDQTGIKLHPTTTNHYPTNTRDQIGIKHYPTTTRDKSGIKLYQTTTNHYQTTTKNKTGIKNYLTTTNHYPPPTRAQTGAKHYLTTTNHYPSTTIAQTGAKHYVTTATVTTSALPKLPTIKKGPLFIMIKDDGLETLEEEEITRPTLAGDCNYDPCRHWQVPCRDLRHLTGCHCPDIAGEDVPPDPVKIQKVVKISDNSAEIYWCAPSSTVLHYYIIYQSDDNRHLYKTDTINPTYRRYTLHDLTSDSTYHSCVVAVNKAGSSTASSIWPSKGPCYIFKTKPNYNNMFYIASTVIIAFLFILVVLLSVCLCKIRLKGRLTDLSRLSLDPLTLQNPAFDNHLELVDPRTIGTVSADSEENP